MFPAEWRRAITRHTRIFSQGDATNNLYLVAQGAISLARSNADGKEVVVAFLVPGDFFGEEALFGRRSRDTTAVCLDAGSIFVISPASFAAAARKDPELPLRLASNISLRFEQLMQTFEDLAFSTVEMRLVMLFDRLASRYGVATGDGTLVHIKLTHAQIGSFVGSTRETVSVQLSTLIRRDRVRVDGPFYVLLHQRTRLSALAVAVPAPTCISARHTEERLSRAGAQSSKVRPPLRLVVPTSNVQTEG